jgi:hypothetical protein
MGDHRGGSSGQGDLTIPSRAKETR